MYLSTALVTVIVFNSLIHIESAKSIEILHNASKESSRLSRQIEKGSLNSYKYLDNAETANSVLNVSNLLYVTRYPTIQSTGKKWKVGRVSRKQYEIVNMLWRKTNIFDDVDNDYPEHFNDRNYNMKVPEWSSPSITPNADSDKFTSPIFQTSTMSYIEFYYLDENLEHRTAQPDKNQQDMMVEEFHNLKQFMSKSPLFAFRINNPTYKRSTPNPHMRKGFEKIQTQNLPNFQVKSVKFSVNNPVKKSLSPVFLELSPDAFRDSPFLQNFFMKENVAEYDTNHSSIESSLTATTSSVTVNTITAASNINGIGKNDTEFPIPIHQEQNVTIASDKIKFFELYDSNTHSPGSVLLADNNEKIQSSVDESEESELSKNNNNKYSLENVDKDLGHGPNNIKYAKKHAENFNNYFDNVSTVQEKFVTKVLQSTLKPTMDLQYDNSTLIKNKQKPKMTRSEISHRAVSKLAAWTDYPFAAVYVYERYQVHCDAAAISPHWLVASASCISRHSEDPLGEDRSAFVTYCGENWWNPGRITYVKYTVVHPRFHPKDSIRRHEYNIGVIQVVTSMPSSCPKWAPISIMSHQYVAEVEGTVGIAVGWGLDRYDTSYASNDLPRRPLSLYESLIYSDNCPGNAGYRNTKRQSREAVENVYCLSLPPYAGEDVDPVHGGMLLVGGKLIALYLQEERRRWGEQSAQYTGIWRLVPWVLEVAHEPEELDYFIEKR